MSNLTRGTLQLVFKPDMGEYWAMEFDPVRRSKILLEFMQEMRLEVAGVPGFPGTWEGEIELPVVNGRYNPDELLAVVLPKLKTYSDKRNDYHNTNDRLFLRDAADKMDVYYYHTNVIRWCREAFDIMVQLGDGTSKLWELERPHDPNVPDSGRLTAVMQIVFTHSPIEA